MTQYLLTKLSELYDADNIPTVEEDGRLYFDYCELVNEVTHIAEEALITEKGGCNYTNISLIRENGYRVFPGDQDSFGWLIGCIQKKDDNRILTYG